MLLIMAEIIITNIKLNKLTTYVSCKNPCQ